MHQSILVKLSISYMFVLDPSVFRCVIDMLKSIEFPYEILCSLGTHYLVEEERFADAVGSPELSVSRQDHGNMVIEWCSCRRP